MSARDFFDVVGRGRRWSSVISLFRQRGRAREKNQILRSISKTSNLSKIQDFQAK